MSVYFRAHLRSGRERAADQRSLEIRVRGIVINHCRGGQLPVSRMELDQLQECTLDWRQRRRLLRQEGVPHAAQELLQLRGQLRVQILTDAREDEEQAVGLSRRDTIRKVDRKAHGFDRVRLRGSGDAR